MDSLLGDEEFDEIVYRDDKEKFLKILCPSNISMHVMRTCATMKAKKCLLAMIEGDGCTSAFEVYAKEAAICPEAPTPLATVACFFPQAYDFIQLLLTRGPSEHANIKCTAHITCIYRCPLDHLLLSLSFEPELHSWAPGNSLKKLVILLCHSKMKSILDSARLLAYHTEGINDIAWTYVREGRLISLAALLLVAQGQFTSGSTIRQRITDMVDALTSEGDLDDEGAKYQCMLVDAYKLLDIFERVGGDLSSYCSSMREDAPPHKVVTDAAGILKDAGFVLQPMDVDLRDIYRESSELCNARLFKLADPPSSNKEPLFPSSFIGAQCLSATRYKYPYVGDCHLLHKVKSGPMVNLVPSGSMPRLFSTAAAQIDNAGSRIPLKHLAYIAFRLKRGMKA